MDAVQLREIVRRIQTLNRRVRMDGPQTDDELHAWVWNNLKVNIPRVAVCDDHDPPFKLLADCYFERLSVKLADGSIVNVQGALCRANRGGAKTFIVAILHFLNATFKPGCEGIQFGASEAQANRCYEKIEDWCFEHDDKGSRLDVIKPFILDKPKKSETKWRNGGKVEIVAGSEKAVSGPHNQKAGADEIDQMEIGVWNQSRGIAVAKQATGPLPDWMSRFNGVIPPQDIATSTMNTSRGLMKELLDEYTDDVNSNNVPAFQVTLWCIWETMSEIPDCRGANSEERDARLKALGRNPDDLCACNKVKKGRMSDGSDRTLEKVCDGRAFKSRGWKPYVDLISSFKRNTPNTWILQHECREAQNDNNYIQNWSLDSYGVKNWEPKPEYGPIYQGIDWGGRNPYCSLWFQYLTADVSCYDHEYRPIFLSAGTYVLFKEIYTADTDTGKFASRVQIIENAYRSQYGSRWNVKGRFMDPQGKGDRNLFARKGMKGSWPVITRNKERMINVVQNLVIDDRLAVDAEGAPMWSEEVEVWQKDEKTGNEIDSFNHAMAAFRYGIANAEVIEGTKAINASRRSGQVEKKKANKNFATLHLEKDGPVAFSGGKSHPTDQFKQMS